MAKRSREILKLLLRREDPKQLLTFFRALEEGFAVSFADAHSRIPAAFNDRPAVAARGNLRRHLMDKAFYAAAKAAGFVPSTDFTVPPTWCFPVIRLGAFSVTLGIVDKPRANGPRHLRGRGKYVSNHARNNWIADPQGSLLHDERDVPRVIPSGSLGALIVAEASVYQTDVPRWCGFWLPSPDLRRPYFRCSLDVLLASLRERTLAGERQARAVRGQPVERKKPVLKSIKKRKPSGD